MSFVHAGNWTATQCTITQGTLYRNSGNMFNPVLISLCCYKCHYINRITPFYRSVCSAYRVLNAVSFRPCTRPPQPPFTRDGISFLTTSSCSKCYIFSVVVCHCFSPCPFFAYTNNNNNSATAVEPRFILINVLRKNCIHAGILLFSGIYWSRDVVAALLCWIFFFRIMSLFENRYAKRTVKSIYVTDKRCQHDWYNFQFFNILMPAMLLLLLINIECYVVCLSVPGTYSYNRDARGRDAAKGIQMWT